jgi:uncharacterized protein YlxP (DUF503 family)
MTMQVWSAADFSLNFAGIELDEDAIGPDSFFEFEQLEPDYKLRKGIGGGATRSQMKRPGGKLTVHLRQCAAVNTTLSVLHNLDVNTPGGIGVAPIMGKDRNGNYILEDTEAFIEGAPPWKVGKEEGDVDWVIICASPNQLTGGH